MVTFEPGRQSATAFSSLAHRRRSRMKPSAATARDHWRQVRAFRRFGHLISKQSRVSPGAPAALADRAAARRPARRHRRRRTHHACCVPPAAQRQAHCALVRSRTPPGGSQFLTRPWRMARPSALTSACRSKILDTPHPRRRVSKATRPPPSGCSRISHASSSVTCRRGWSPSGSARRRQAALACCR